jgi:hypothetical protein
MKPEGKHLTPLMTDNRFYVPERTLSGRRWAIRGFARNYFTKEDIDELVSSCPNHVVDYHKFPYRYHSISRGMVERTMVPGEATYS